MSFPMISLVYDKCVKDANGYGFPDGPALGPGLGPAVGAA